MFTDFTLGDGCHPKSLMWMFYILGTFVYIMECTWLDLYRISLSNVSLFKHSSSFWISCSKAANIEKRGEGNIKHQSQFLFLPVVLRIFTPQCFMLPSELLSKEQAEHTDFKSLLPPKYWCPCVSGRFQIIFVTTFPLVTFSMAQTPWFLKGFFFFFNLNVQ